MIKLNRIKFQLNRHAFKLSSIYAGQGRILAQTFSLEAQQQTKIEDEKKKTKTR